MKRFFIDEIFLFSAATIIPEEPIESSTMNKTSLANVLATPAVRRLAKELQVMNDRFDFPRRFDVSF